MGTIPPLSSQVKLLKEGRRFERDDVKKPSYRALCYDCTWKWQSDSDTSDPKSAEDRANAHMANEKHHAQVVMDIIGVHYADFDPARLGGR